MKKFEDLCYMTQKGVKEYMNKYLASKKYEVVNENGFLYAKGDVPVLLVAHMDTVHKAQCSKIIEVDGKLSSPQGIGGDDRCGVFIIANLIKKHHCSVLLCEDEEAGGVGASKFAKTEYIKNLDVNFMIEFDRKGSNDAVFYSCDNKDFTAHVLDHTGYKEQSGSFTDISVLMPASKLCGVNLSCGYYSPHKPDEYVVYTEMLDTINAAEALITAECEKPFEYVAKTYQSYRSYGNNSYGGGLYGGSSYGRYAWDDYYGDDYDVYGTPKKNKKKEDLPAKIREDIYLDLTVSVINEAGQTEFMFATGHTKAECWLDLFTSYPGICMDDIVDYEFE